MKIISATQFDKLVDIEFAYMTHVERMSDEKARVAARQAVAEKYQIG